MFSIINKAAAELTKNAQTVLTETPLLIMLNNGLFKGEVIQKLIFNIPFLLLLYSNSVYSEISENTQNEIRYLLTHIEQSECVFNRNGTDYEGSKVVPHINKKYDYFKDEIKTTEDFIALSATKSELSGRKYTVRCNEGQTEELGKWLIEALSALPRNLEH